MDIHISFKDILKSQKKISVPKEISLKMNYGYPKIDLWISLNQII